MPSAVSVQPVHLERSEQGFLVTFAASGNQPTFVTTANGGYSIHYGVLGSIQVHLGGLSDLPLRKKDHPSTSSQPGAKS